MRHRGSIWRIERVAKATVIAGRIPTASLSPFAPGHVVVRRTEGISRFYGRAIEAPAGVAGAGCVTGHGGPHGQGKYQGSADNSKVHHAFLFGKFAAGDRHRLAASRFVFEGQSPGAAVTACTNLQGSAITPLTAQSGDSGLLTSGCGQVSMLPENARGPRGLQHMHDHIRSFSLQRGSSARRTALTAGRGFRRSPAIRRHWLLFPGDRRWRRPVSGRPAPNSRAGPAVKWSRRRSKADVW
jgi:hypothetical protein